MIKYEVKGLDSALKKLNRITSRMDRIDSYVEKFTCRLAEIGLDKATVSFSEAEYDGTNDVRVTLDVKKPNLIHVVASGKAVLFIEFGTGINYPDDHPLANTLGMVHGEYGKKQGQKESWVYIGEEGTNGKVVRSSESGNAVRTRGNPASRSMYITAEEIRKNIEKIAKEVFK